MIKKAFYLIIFAFFCLTSWGGLAQESTLKADKLQKGWVLHFSKESVSGGAEGDYGLAMYFLPESEIQSISSNAKKYYVDSFGFNTAPPSIETVFYDLKNNCEYAIVLVKWHIFALGANTDADYYQISAYKLIKDGSTHLIKDEKISESLGEGYDGTEDGSTKIFAFKTASDIRKKFRSVK